MAYDTSTPPQLLVPSLNDQSPAIWTYVSTDAGSDVDTLVTGNGYFSDGQDLGMKVGDLVLVQDTDNNYATTMHVVSGVTADGADLSDGTSVGSATDSD